MIRKIVLLIGLSTLLASCSEEPTTLLTTTNVEERDPFLQPFTSTSIWNMPIGSEAKYVDAGLGPAYGTVADVVHVLRMKKSDPLQQAYVPSKWFDTDIPRCSGRERIDLQLRLPDDYIVPDIGNSPYGRTPNSTFAFVLPNGRKVLSGAVARCEEGGPVYLVPHMKYPNNIKNLTTDLYTDGYNGGGHGATKMSAFGGLLRAGELTNDEPIRHVLKLMIWSRHLYHDASEKTPGYRWPARAADRYAPERYKGTNPALQMGSLVAIRPDVQESSLGLETKAGRKMFRALRDYGAYLTEDPNWNAHAVTIAEDAYTEFEETYGYSLEERNTPWARDLNRLVSELSVVKNNYPDSVGGGGEPRQPLAPPLRR